MKIKSDKKEPSILSFDELLRNLIHEHKNVFMEKIDEEIFIYKALSRKYYKEVVLNPSLNELQREEEVCYECVLWPKDIDWDDVDAGIPTKLYEVIMEQSFLTNLEDVADLIEVNREDLELFDMQMSCIISEAFPNYDMEDIESWDMLKLCKMFTRAEWKLANLRNMQTNDIAETLRRAVGAKQEEVSVPKAKPKQEDILNKEMDSMRQQNNEEYLPPTQSAKQYKVGNKIMSEMEYRKYEQTKSMYPEIDWGVDTMFTGFESVCMDTTNPALKTP